MGYVASNQSDKKKFGLSHQNGSVIRYLFIERLNKIEKNWN